jgi:hypothetical protein
MEALNCIAGEREMNVMICGRTIRADAAARLIVMLGVAAYLVAVGAPVALGALAVVVVLEWADRPATRLARRGR